MIYDKQGLGYSRFRGTDPKIAARLWARLEGCRRILNIGAGTGNYEPPDRATRVIAVEPSEVMIRQRPIGAAPCVRALAERLPFPEAAFDGAYGVLTMHHWSNLEAGLAELRRTVRGPIVFLTWDPEARDDFWLTRDYIPEVRAFDLARFPKRARVEAALGGIPLEAETVPIPRNCADGFKASYWARPEAYLDAGVRRSISGISQIEPAAVDRGISKLAADLASGEWHRRNAHLDALDEADLCYRLWILKAA